MNFLVVQFFVDAVAEFEIQIMVRRNDLRNIIIHFKIYDKRLSI